MLMLRGLGDFQIDPSGPATFCANNPTDPLCNNGARPGATASSFINAHATYFPTITGTASGALAPPGPSGAQAAASGSMVAPFQSTAGFLSFKPGWYLTWWGMLLLAGAGYAGWRYYNKSKGKKPEKAV